MMQRTGKIASGVFTKDKIGEKLQEETYQLICKIPVTEEKGINDA